MHVLTVSDVCEIINATRSTKVRTKGEAYRLFAAANRRLAQAKAGELALAPQVRTPLEVVVRLLVKLRWTGLAQLNAAKAAERELAAREADEAAQLAEFRELVAAERLAEHMAQVV